MTEHSTAARYSRAQGFVVRRVAGEVLLVQTSARSVQPIQRSTDLLVLNPAGERVWEALVSPSTADELAQYLIQDFEVDMRTAREDVATFLVSMEAVGAVVRTKSDNEG